MLQSVRKICGQNFIGTFSIYYIIMFSQIFKEKKKYIYLNQSIDIIWIKCVHKYLKHHGYNFIIFKNTSSLIIFSHRKSFSALKLGLNSRVVWVTV